MGYSRLQRFTGFLVVYCVIIILWGAWVRISGSGDGCGAHWPLCHGVLIPTAELEVALKTWIELFHRLKSGLFGVFVFAALIWAYRVSEKGHLVRKAALAVFIFTTIEALIGAALVLFGWVGENAGFGRWKAMSLHLGNTLLLLGSLSLLWVACGSKRKEYFQFSLSQFKKALPLILILLLTAVTGAWAALASTLYPSDSLLSGFFADFSSDSPLILRLRILHPILAILSVLFFLLWMKPVMKRGSYPKLSLWTFSLYWLHLGFGFFTLLFLAPVWMKLSHLFLADAFWILWTCLLAKEVFVVRPAEKI